MRSIKKSSQAICSLRRRWRRRWDSNPRDLAVYLISSQARYDHFDTPPCVFFARFFLFFMPGAETPSERTDGKNYGIFSFRTREKPHGYGLCAIRNAQSLRRFRVRAVMTTSIRFLGVGRLTDKGYYIRAERFCQCKSCYLQKMKQAHGRCFRTRSLLCAPECAVRPDSRTPGSAKPAPCAGCCGFRPRSFVLLYQ